MSSRPCRRVLIPATRTTEARWHSSCGHCGLASSRFAAVDPPEFPHDQLCPYQTVWPGTELAFPGLAARMGLPA